MLHKYKARAQLLSHILALGSPLESETGFLLLGRRFSKDVSGIMYESRG